jgi:hypothetical protein
VIASFLIVMSAFLAAQPLQVPAESGLAVTARVAEVSTPSPLPRIAIRSKAGTQGEFFRKDTGEPFQPRGFNHVILEHGSTGWHALFNVGVYDGEAADVVLSEMAALGTNVVRVWCWGTQKASGYTGDKTARGLNDAYMENVIDFLRRATKYGIYVLPIFDEVPENAYYNEIRDEAPQPAGEDRIHGYNAQYLSSGPIAAKRQCIADFIRHIAAKDRSLLSSVFGWSLANEVFVRNNGAPFSRSEGTVTTATGRTYDLADSEGRQRCWDESVLHWANELADAIHEVDPEALVTAGMWTSDAHARPPVNGLLPDDKDSRFPPRPSVLGGAESSLDFLDVHIYPWDGTSKVSRVAHERDGVVIPAIAGEYGVFKNKKPDEARIMLREMLEQAYAMGYMGDLFWVWDLRVVAGQTWSAVEEDFGACVMQERNTETDHDGHLRRDGDR